MTTCASGQLPYMVSDGGGVDVLGASPGAACEAMAAWYGSHGYGPAAVTSYDAATCNWYYNGGIPLTRPVTTVCTPDSSTPGGSSGTFLTCAGSCTVTHVVQLADAAFVDHLGDLGITPTAVSSAVGFGLAFVLTLWGLGYMIGVGKRVVDQV